MRVSPLLVLATIPLLSGCVAALLPIAAVGVIGKGEIDRAKAKREIVAAGAINVTRPIVTVGEGDKNTKFLGKSEQEKSIFAGQGEGFEIADGRLGSNSNNYLSPIIQPVAQQDSPYAGFASHALAQSALLAAEEDVKSVVLIPKINIFNPKTLRCKGKPLAVLIDLDDEKNSNLMEAETLYRQNGLVEVLASLREAEISVIWVSDEPASAAGAISAMLAEGGLSEDGSDDFLFLDRGGEDRKQERRWDAARNYCIVAIAGDDRADFDELYDYLRNPNGAIALEPMFGNGWFLTPPPLVVANDEKKSTSVDEEKGS